jgi:hypothetical protein
MVSAVESYCGWHVAPSCEDTLTLDGDGSTVLLLPTLHVTDVASVVEDGVTLDPASYTWSERGVLRKYGRGRWICKDRAIEVTFTHGYAAMPDDLQAIVTDLGSRPAGGGVVQVGQVRMATARDGSPLGAGLTDAQKGTLNRYRLNPRP